MTSLSVKIMNSGPPSEQDSRSQGSSRQTEESEEEDFTEENNVGTNLDTATIDFLNEASCVRALRIQGAEIDGSTRKQLNTLDYAQYLGIDLAIEPEMTWIAREMCGSPMPPTAEILVSKSGIVYFHDIENDYYTLEHPLTQRFLKVLERQRLDTLATRSKPAVSRMVFCQPDVLFHKMFRNLQVPCQDCGMVQSVLRCEQCMQSFCQPCFDLLHSNTEGPRKYHLSIPTSVGSMCSSCGLKKPQAFCASCDDYLCFPCFQSMHRKGYRTGHRAVTLKVNDGEIVEPTRLCEECGDSNAMFHCDFCADDFCIPCFWRTHLNGNRRTHTVTKLMINPLCSQCNRTRATVFCEQCHEIFCSDCFTLLHYKGNRQLHLFSDARDILLLMEKMDPAFQEHMQRARPKVMWAITRIQGWSRGIGTRVMFRKRKDVVHKIQRQWRGAMTRKKLLAMLDHFKWRKKQINSYFLPKTRHERMVIKQKFLSQINRKKVSSGTATATLKELKDTVMATVGADPLEDAVATRNAMYKPDDAIDMISRPGEGGQARKGPGIAIPVPSGDSYDKRFGEKKTSVDPKVAASVLTSDSLASRFHANMEAKQLRSLKDPRQIKDTQIRSVMQIDDRTQPAPVVKRASEVKGKGDKQ